MSDEIKQPQRLIIKSMIEEGNCTKDSIKKQLNMTASTLATNFTYLRLMGFCPIADENGILSFVDTVTWENMKAEKSANAKSRANGPAKTPQERYYAVCKKIARCEKAQENAAKANETIASEVNDLKMQRANIDFQITLIEKEALVESNPEINVEETSKPIEATTDDDVVETEESIEDDGDIEELV